MTCVDAVCVKPRVEPDPRFSCREKSWNKIGTEDVSYPLRISQLLGDQPLSEVTIEVCPNFDDACENPLSESVSDENGEFSLELPEGFRGHLLAGPPESDPDIVPVKAYVFPPPSTDPEVPKRPGLVVTSMAVIQGLASLDNVLIVPGNGHLIFTAIDCKGVPLEGVQVRTSHAQDDTWRVYVGSGGQPDPALEATGPVGKGAILNLPPGYLKVIAEHPVHGKIFEQSVVVTSNTLTSVPIVPSPVPKR